MHVDKVSLLIICGTCIIANFQFYIDEKSKEIFEGITLHVSSGGLGFLLETIVKEGQTITRHALPDFSGQKAKLIWVKKGPLYVEAGSKIQLIELQKRWFLAAFT